MSKSPSLPHYQKPWLSFRDQVALFQSRGLVIADLSAAEDFLRHTNYYRFSGYCVAFEAARHQFQAGTTFEQVQDVYEFDRILRDYVTEALEVVEIDFRTAVAYHFGQTHGPFGHTNPANFFKRFDHHTWLGRLHDESTRSKERFVEHFRLQYSGFPDLPVWVITEIMSFGGLSKMCNGMLRSDQKAIAHQYGLQPRDWVSWLHHLTYVRNLCAHHARLWDRQWSISPYLPGARHWQPPAVPSNKRLFVTLLILHYLMKRCPSVARFAADWRGRVETLIDQAPPMSGASALMGLGTNWKTHPLWK